MTTDEQSYFAFCDYRAYYPHHILFVPLNHDLITQVEQLLKIFNHADPKELIINKVYENIDDNCSSLIGYSVGDVFIHEKEKKKIINYWSNLIGNYFFGFDEDDDQILTYTVNDKNRHLSPKDLYSYIKSLTLLYDQKIKVATCVMLSDRAVEYQPSICIRFLINTDTKYPASQINELLSGIDSIVAIQSAQDEEGNFTGYGYVKVKTVSAAEDLISQTMQINDLLVRFDRG